MTEPRIRDLLSFVEAERVAATHAAAELAELAVDVVSGSADLDEVADRLRALAMTAAGKVETIDRLAPAGFDSEDTAPIVLDTIRCARCRGTGEVPACRS